MLRSLSSSSNEGQVNVGGHCAGELLLCLLSSLLQSLHSHLVAGQVYALCLLELRKHPLNNLVIEIITTQMCITIGCKNLDDTVADLDDGYVEGTAAQVVNHDLLLFLVVQTVCQSRSCRLIDDSLDIQTCNLTCILGSLTLSIVEVCGNSDNCLRYLLTQIALCICLQLLQNHSGNLLRRILLVIDGATAVGTHISLDGSDCLLSVCYSLTLCRLTHKSLTCLCKSHNGRCGSCAFCVCDNGRLTAFHNCHAAVCCSQVNTNNLTHFYSLLFLLSIF